MGRELKNRALEIVRLDEWVFDSQAFDFTSGLKIFAIKLFASTLQGRRNDERVIPRNPMVFPYPQGLEIDRR